MIPDKRVQPPEECSGCGAREGLTVTLYAGVRCPACPPVFDPAVAVGLHVAGWPGTALAYIRAAS